MNKKPKEKKTIKTAQAFFEHYIDVVGELELYRTLYGELPTNKDATINILRMRRMAEEARPLMEELNLCFERQGKNE